MPQFISSNPVTETIRQNQELATRQALQNMQVQNAIAQDKLARGIASIYAEPAPVAPPPTVTTQADYSLQQSRPSVGFKSEGSISGLQQGSALDGFKVPELAQDLPDRNVITQQPALPDTRAQRALQLAASTPGGGEMALQLTQHQQSAQVTQQKERKSRLDKVHELISTGDLQGAQRYAQIHGLNEVLPLFANPRALATVQSLGSFAHKQLGLDGRDAAAFSETALKSMSEGKSYQDAFIDAYSAIKGLPSQVTRVVTDDAGNVTGITKYGEAVPIQGVRGKSRSAGVAKASTVQRTFVAQDGSMMAIMKDGSTKQLTNAQGRPIYSNEINRFAGQVYLKSADMPGASIEQAQITARQLYPGGTVPQTTPSVAPNAQTNAGVVKRFVPGQGFVTK